MFPHQVREAAAAHAEGPGDLPEAGGAGGRDGARQGGAAQDQAAAEDLEKTVQILMFK